MGDRLGRTVARRAIPRWSQLGQMLGLSLLMVAGTSTAYYALERIPATLLVIVVYTYPALVAVASRRFGAGLRGRRNWLGLALAFVGVLLAVGFQTGEIDPAGLAVALLTPLVTTLVLTWQAYIAGERPGATASRRLHEADLGVRRHTEVEPAVLGAVVMSLGAAIFAAGALVAGAPLLDPGRTREATVRLVLLGVAAGALAVPLNYAAAGRIGAALTAVTGLVEVALVAVTSAIFLGERLTPLQLAGCALVVASIGVVAGTAARHPAGVAEAAPAIP